ncbi:MAG: hypothetical protein R2795_14795 [Saprospiraceae bacterium]
MLKHAVVVCLWVIVAPVWAQLPQSNIYLFQMKQVTDSVFQFTSPQYLTHFNANGYNNQPAFFNNDELYISCQLPSQQQPELYLLNLKTRNKLRVTETVEGSFLRLGCPIFTIFLQSGGSLLIAIP